MAAVYQLKIKCMYDQDKLVVVFFDTKHLVSFPHEEKHVVKEKMLFSRSAFQCTTRLV